MLKKLMKDLKRNNKKEVIYKIPILWNTHQDKLAKSINENELIVNPYIFYFRLIKYIYKHKKRLKTKKEWIKKAAIYSMMPRLSGSYDHGDNYLKTGTFIKCLAILPYLYKMGIDTIYLLPIFKYARENKKGNLGSPYAIMDFYKLDNDLKDSLTTLSIDDEFKCFVEAAHLLNIKIIIDIIPRTIARSNDLIKDHPEWFYWIKANDLKTYKSLKINKIPATMPPLHNYMKIVYQDETALNHINKFMQNPKEQDLALWKKIDKTTDSIKTNFNLVIAPAFSDWINDPQPIWSDITFFRMYLDNPNPNINANPYILYDSIKCNLYPGNKPNYPLWKMLQGIIPYYIKKFKIDGARIDMGHALPKDLNNEIIAKAKKCKKNFVFIAEELDPEKANEAKNNGYEVIIGNGFYQEPRINGPLQWFMRNSHTFALPIFAMGESHDTPRLAKRDGGKTLSKMLTLLNIFLPNGIFFLNSGQEFFEEMPINTGLDFDHIDSSLILGLFDYYVLNYQNENMITEISECFKIKNKYLYDILNPLNLIDLTYIEGDAITFCFKIKNQILLVIGNDNPFNKNFLKINASNISLYTKKGLGTILFSTSESYPKPFNSFDESTNPYFYLEPGEVKIIAI